MTSSFVYRVIKKSMATLSNTSGYDDHTKPHHDVTLGQMTTFVLYTVAAILSVIKSFGSETRLCREQEHELKKLTNGNSENKDVTVEIKEDKTPVGNDAQSKEGDQIKRSTPPPPPTFDAFLRYVVVLGIVMVYFYLCDYIKVFPVTPRNHNQDTFLFLVFMLFIVACSFTIRPTKDTILNRDQTEEWKGWMQVMFVWYHYFAAKEWYNWIRVYIACYVWMTGFGNFSFFWVRKDFGLWRFLKMMFRLNFLVIMVVLTTNNEYMLYYICAMHTYWFISVYVFMRVLNSWNEDRVKMAAKFAAYIICNALIFEIPGVCSEVFRPFKFIFGLRDPKYDIMHEWEFRAGLDHWACLTGMLCAYNYPNFEAFMKRLEKDAGSLKEKYTQLAIKVAMVTVALVVGIAWYFIFMRKEKYAYNATHPYSSLIPIIVFIVLRNSFPILRRYYIHMFAWLGKITLETYLSQLHIYLQSNAKALIGYITGYPLLTFSLATIIYLSVSYVLFHLTTEFSAYLIPKDMKTLSRQLSVGLVVVILSVGVAYIVRISIAGQNVHI